MKNLDHESELRYQRAKKRVKKIKGFYFHLLIYLFIVFLVFVSNFLNRDITDNFGGMAIWGVGLALHGVSVFLPQFMMGEDWEERKIREIMNKNR